MRRCQNGGMRFRIGMVVGFVAGYVLGSRAGRERYEQIKRMAARLRESPAFSQVMSQATGVTDMARNLVAGGIEVGSDKLRKAAEPPA